MFGFINELDFGGTKADGGDKFPIKAAYLHAFGGETQKACFLGNQLDVILLTILHCEVEKILKFEDTVTDETSVVSLTNR